MEETETRVTLGRKFVFLAAQWQLMGPAARPFG